MPVTSLRRRPSRGPSASVFRPSGDSLADRLGGGQNRPMPADLPDPERARLEEALAAADAAREAAEEELVHLQARMDNAQALAHMGDYDWHITTDKNRWSDELYRIYGFEPQSFNASYDRFLSLIHPEDRERITAIHQQAYATGEPYEMMERVVRPDGEIRYLRSNGQVVMGADGAPERMRGTCVDVTDQVLAEREREAAAARLQEVRLRRRQAAEINDNVVQGLTAAMYALELGDATASMGFLDRTLAAARAMMDDMMQPLAEGEPEVDLVRTQPATLQDPA